ncbi:MAG: carboxypeptidase regulatory-like domain-containing protein [Gemmatimonadaceae bacterium]|nr:carboxypeptidase regulatory-like domain-containing protein [Gemmatimonadaceae bacterium]
MSAIRLVTGVAWSAAIASVVWAATVIGQFDAAVDAEVALAKDRAGYIWRSQVAAGRSTDSASAYVLEVTNRELAGGYRESTTRLPFISAVDPEALWVAYQLNPIVARGKTMPRTAAESLSLRVAQSKFHQLFRANRPTFEHSVRKRTLSVTILSGGLLVLAMLLTWLGRKRPLPLVALPAVLILVLVPHSRIRAQQSAFAIRGVVRAAGDDKPLSGAILELSGTRFTRQVRSDETGQFSIGAVPTGSYRLSVLRLGYQAIVQAVAVGDRDAQLTIRMTADPTELRAIVTRANVTAIYGGIGAVGSGRNATGEREMSAVADAKIHVIGSRKSATADSVGRFFLELDKPGLYMVRVTSPGLAPQLFPVEVPRNKAVEVSRMMDSARMTAPSGREYMFDEMDRRVGWRAMNSALVTGSELRAAGGALSDALVRSKSMTLRGLRLGVTTCVFLNGIPRPGMPLDAIQIEEVEAVELYGARGDPTGTLASSWPAGAQCGSASRLPPPRSGGIAPPDAKWAAIWTQR